MSKQLYQLVHAGTSSHVRAECNECAWRGAWWESNQEGAAVREAERHVKIKHREEPMKTRAQIDALIAGTEERLAALLAERVEIDRLPAEPDNGMVVRFTVQFAPDGTLYTYVAARFGAWWYTTANTANSRMTWQQILELAGEDAGVRSGDRRLTFTVLEPSYKIRAKQ